MHGIVDEKTDVFAFGVFLLEIISGRKPVDGSHQSLHSWVYCQSFYIYIYYLQLVLLCLRKCHQSPCSLGSLTLVASSAERNNKDFVILYSVLVGFNY